MLTYAQSLGSGLKTLYLFGKSDLLVVSVTTIAIALVLAGVPSLNAFLTGFVWLQLHLLTFQIKNQIDGLEEDRLSKPSRPLPSGRITLANAKTLYYCFFASMWIVALFADTLPCTLAYTFLIVAYNEGRLAEIALSKNVLTAAGMTCYCWGMTVVFSHGEELHNLKLAAVLMVGAIWVTTGHASDFRDRAADAVMKRKTIPLLLPQGLARWSLAALIAIWTAALVYLWQPPLIASFLFTSLAVRTLGGFVASHDEKDDHVSYAYYGLWLLASNTLPIFPRLRGEFL